MKHSDVRPGDFYTLKIGRHETVTVKVLGHASISGYRKGQPVQRPAFRVGVFGNQAASQYIVTAAKLTPVPAEWLIKA